LINQIRIPFLVFVLSCLIIYSLVYFSVFNGERAVSILVGGGISFLNFILFFVLYSISREKPNKYFLILNFGGMVLRMVLMLLGVFLIIKFLKIDTYGFIFGFFFYYILFLGLEVRFIKKGNFKKKSAEYR
jgi:F0F1-type ATP synthase assembly protein I